MRTFLLISAIVVIVFSGCATSKQRLRVNVVTDLEPKSKSEVCVSYELEL